MATAASIPHFASGRFLVLGRAGMDLYAHPPGTRVEEAERFVSHLGGSAANIAVALVKLGAGASIITCLSDDAVGRFCRRALEGYGVGTGHVHTVSGGTRTSLAVVETRLEDCQSVIYRNDAADFVLTPEDIGGVAWGEHAGLIITGTALAKEPSRTATLAALARARAAGLVTIMDVDYRPYSWESEAEARSVNLAAARACDIVIGNDDEFGLMAGDYDKGLALAEAIVAEGAALAIYKMGARGAVTLSPEGRFRTGIYETAALKPTGAGDAFMGGVMAAIAAGTPLRAAVLRGSAAAAITVASVGCAPAFPTTAELDAFLRSHPEPMSD